MSGRTQPPGPGRDDAREYANGALPLSDVEPVRPGAQPAPRPRAASPGSPAPSASAASSASSASAPTRRPIDPFRGNPLLAAPQADESPFRKRLIGISVAIHVVGLLGLLLLPATLLKPEPKPRKIDITFFKPKPFEPPPPAVARNEPKPKPEPPKPKPKPKPKPVEVAKVEPSPPPPPKPRPRETRPEPREATTPVPTPPAPQPQAEPPRRREPVVTNTFAQAAEAPKPEPRRARAAQTGSFGGTSETAPVTDTPQRASRVVAAGSFGSGDVAAVPAEAPRPRDVRVARSGGFGGAADGADDGADDAPRREASVQAGAFGDGRASVAKRGPREQKAAAEPDTPVEILSKPRPAYTQEARDRRIEGEVVLEVTFVADGALRVLRVVDGLGHGLDEAAIAAAKKIEFKPARLDGRPVDHTATLRVVFRLA